MRGLPCLGVLTLCLGLAACQSSTTESVAEEEASPAAVEVPPDPGLVLVKAEDYAFTAPPRFPSGWVKLRFENLGAESHFMLIWDLPDGITFDDYSAEVAKQIGRAHV